jgi:hypothetical protein
MRHSCRTRAGARADGLDQSNIYFTPMLILVCQLQGAFLTNPGGGLPLYMGTEGTQVQLVPSELACVP